MKTLAIIFGLIGLFDFFIAYLPPKFSSAKQRFNTWFLDKCIALQPLNNDLLIKEIKPLMYGVSIFFFFLSIAVLKLRGPQDIEPKQITYAWAGTIFFVNFGLITYHELIDRLKGALRVGTNFVFVSAAALVGIILIVVIVVVSYQAHLTQQPIDPELISQLTIDHLSKYALPFGIALLFIATMVFITMFLIPYLTGRTFLWCVRRVINFIITKEQKDPIKIPLQIVSTFFLVMAIYSYFMG